jgi:plasmid stability protein
MHCAFQLSLWSPQSPDPSPDESNVPAEPDIIDMQAYVTYNACMKRIQYTIRQIPERLDFLIKERATREGKSVNETVLDVLKTGLGVSDEPVRYSDLDDLAGTWVHDPEFDKAIEEMDRIDSEMWK